VTIELRPTIELRGVSRWYGNVVAVNDVTMSIGPGVTGLLGPNGAGKSTIMHMIAGFLPPSRGELTVAGQPSWRHPALYRQVGLVPERDSVYAFLTGQVVVAGRLAASGDFRAIRRLMTSRPHVFTVRSSDDRLLGGALIARPAVTAVELGRAGLQVRTSDYGAFCRDIAMLARDHRIRLLEVLPADESLESVFAYLVAS
jgi:energy-coupling factor transporter ATP-binding protein EcfA2